MKAPDLYKFVIKSWHDGQDDVWINWDTFRDPRFAGPSHNSGEGYVNAIRRVAKTRVWTIDVVTRAGVPWKIDDVHDDADIFEIVETVMTIPIQTARSAYPHTCPKCGQPAYVGFAKVDCSAACN